LGNGAMREGREETTGDGKGGFYTPFSGDEGKKKKVTAGLGVTVNEKSHGRRAQTNALNGKRGTQEEAETREGWGGKSL